MKRFALCKNFEFCDNSINSKNDRNSKLLWNKRFLKITVPSKTKTIGQGAFGSCKDLKTIVMPGDFKLKLEEDTDDKLWYVAK